MPVFPNNRCSELARMPILAIDAHEANRHDLVSGKLKIFYILLDPASSLPRIYLTETSRDRSMIVICRNICSNIIYDHKKKIELT